MDKTSNAQRQTLKTANSGSPVKPCFYPQILATLNKKNFGSPVKPCV